MGQQRGDQPTAQILRQLTSIKFRQGCQNRFLSDQPSNCTKLKERFLFLRNHAVKLGMEGLICELLVFQTLGMENRVYSTENQI